MIKAFSTAALAALLVTGLTVAAHAASHGGASEARNAYNAALDKCEEMKGDQRSDCYSEAMEQYRLAREKEEMK